VPSRHHRRARPAIALLALAVLAACWTTAASGQRADTSATGAPAGDDSTSPSDTSAAGPPVQAPLDPFGEAEGLPRDETFGRLTARGLYEIRALATDSLLGREEWELFEDGAGFLTLRATTTLGSEGVSTMRSGSVTLSPDLAFVEADLGSTASGAEAYATYRRAGDLLTVQAYGAADGETRQQVTLPRNGVFVSQLFVTRGWELAPFENGDDEARPAYLAGSAPGVLVGEVRRLRARVLGTEQIDVPPGRFRVLLFEVPGAGDASGPTDDAAGERDRWWVLPGSRVPAAAELPSLGIRLELAAFETNPEPEDPPPLTGPVLARGVYHHRPLRSSEPVALESWTLTAADGGGYVLESEVAHADGRNVVVHARADSLFRIREVTLRRRSGSESETVTWRVRGDSLEAEARGASTGLARQRLAIDGPVLFRLDVAALEGWGITAGGGGPRSTYWLPAGPHPLGTLLRLPPEVDMGSERLSTPARTFTTRRYASPALTPPLLRSTRWVFAPFRLPARVVFAAEGREAILVRYETPE
jgi:hypothetical protein